MHSEEIPRHRHGLESCFLVWPNPLILRAKGTKTTISNRFEVSIEA